MKRLLYILLFTLPLVNCQSNTKNEHLLTPDKFSEALQKLPNIQLIDVRTPNEFNTSHLKGAVNIDYNSGNFSEAIKTLDKNKPVYVYCRSGNRSGKSVSEFKKQGFTQIYDLKGGILNWTQKGLDVTQ